MSHADAVALVRSSPPDPIQLCRTLLAYTTPGNAVAVPHAALAALVDLASGTADGVSGSSSDQGALVLSQLYDVASLAQRYGRAPATVRQWFATGLFGPAKDRLFRGRGYVASAECVQQFEERTGIRTGYPAGLSSVAGEADPWLIDTRTNAAEAAVSKPSSGDSKPTRGPVTPSPVGRGHSGRTGRPKNGVVGGRIREAAAAGRRRG